MEIEKRTPELVIIPSQIDCKKGLYDAEDFVSCYDCKSPLFYFKINYGIVTEELNYGILGYRAKRQYALREVGLCVHCAKCGAFLENYSKWFFPEDKLLMYDMDILDADERAEIENCLTQFNQHGSFKSRYKSGIFKELKEKLAEYEKKHPIKIPVKTKKIIKDKKIKGRKKNGKSI